MFVLAQEASSGLGSLTSLLPILLVGAVFWFLVIRPQRNRQKEREAMLSTLSVGSEVVTVGGLFGEVEALDDNWVDLLVGDDVVLRFSRTAIGRIATPEDQATLEAFMTGVPLVHGDVHHDGVVGPEVGGDDVIGGEAGGDEVIDADRPRDPDPDATWPVDGAATSDGERAGN